MSCPELSPPCVFHFSSPPVAPLAVGRPFSFSAQDLRPFLGLGSWAPRSRAAARPQGKSIPSSGRSIARSILPTSPALQAYRIRASGIQVHRLCSRTWNSGCAPRFHRGGTAWRVSLQQLDGQRTKEVAHNEMVLGASSASMVFATSNQTATGDKARWLSPRSTPRRCRFGSAQATNPPGGRR
jgi:hypothetical protein